MQVIDVWKSPQKKERVTQLVGGERFSVLTKEGDLQQVCCLDQPQLRDGEWGGYVGWIEAEQSQAPPLPDRADLIDWVEEWLGVPYLWGGMTAKGIDCSGLVHLAFRMQGQQIPRDACDQQQWAQSISFEELQPGDLLFSPGHVMLFSGGDTLLEASGPAKQVRRYSVKERLHSAPLTAGRPPCTLNGF